MATEPSSLCNDPLQVGVHDTLGAITALFGVKFGVEQSGMNAEDALNSLVSLGHLNSVPGPASGFFTYTDVVTQETFVLVDDQVLGRNINLNTKDISNAIIDTGKSGLIIADKGSDETKTIIADDARHVFRGASGADTVVVTGDGKSHIVTRGGDDHVILAGHGKGHVHARAGDDQVTIIGSANNVVTTGRGNDIVRIDGDGNNRVKTGGGDDFVCIKGNGTNWVNTKSGNDTIIFNEGTGNTFVKGGKGQDLFVVGSDRTGTDTIRDFGKGDVLRIADRNQDGTVDQGDITSIQQVKHDVVITLEHGGTIILKHVDVKDLQQNDDGTFTLK